MDRVRIMNATLYATNARSKYAGESTVAGSIAIVNEGVTAARAGISIDGHLFGDRDEVLGQIATLPPMFDGEPDYRKAWRFLSRF